MMLAMALRLPVRLLSALIISWTDSDYSGAAIPLRTDKERVAVRGQHHLHCLKSHAVPCILHARAPP